MRIRPERPPIDVAPGERLLAWATARDGAVVGGTRDALYLPGRRVPWEQVQAADWDKETSVLLVSEVGAWGEVRPEHEVLLDEPGRLLQLVRERVTASVVLQRHVPISGKGGVRVIARRAPGSHAPLTWLYEYDQDVDPDDPFVVMAAQEALIAARDEIELG